MDMAGDDTRIEPQKESHETVNYHPSNIPLNWSVNQNHNNGYVEMVSVANKMMDSSACSSAPTAIDSFGPPIWDHHFNVQNLGYSDMHFQSEAGTSSSSRSVRPESGLLLTRDTFQPGFPDMLPKSLPHLPTDIGLIERAARFSCFNGGSFAQMTNGFALPDSVNPCIEVLRGSNEIHGGILANSLAGMQPLEGRFIKNSRSFKDSFDEEKCLSGNESDEVEFSGYGEMDGMLAKASHKGFVSKKRKHEEEDENDGVQQGHVDTSKEKDDIKPNGDQNQTKKGKSEGKNAKSQGSDLPKEGYVHIRARRGQATNSHSLAERVRREKISERMKFLQDLVPGCSKVTGKAVMLDEIINYVQSLQRQVEFLSMKLATVNSRMDLNLEALLAKDMLHLQPRVGMPSSMAFQSHVATVPFSLLQHEHGIMQTGLVGSSSETIQRPPCETASQVPDCWKDDLHNIVHMGFNSSTSNSQDLNGSPLPPNHTKGEP